MSRRAAIVASLLSTHVHAGDDLLRFSNGDQLHGSFKELKPDRTVVWQRDDIAAPVELDPEKLRHIVFNGGQPRNRVNSLAHVALANGDRIPGEIVSLDDESAVIDSELCGTIHIPRKQIAALSPAPFGGKVFYHGPFSEEGWKRINPTTREEDEAEAEGKLEDWEFTSSAWYWAGKSKCPALAREEGFGDQVNLRFDLAWKSRLSLVIALHADFAPIPEAAEGEKAPARRPVSPSDISSLPRYFGNCYAIQLNSSYAVLYWTRINEDGDTSFGRVQGAMNHFQMPESGRGTIEIRCDRKNRRIALHVADEFICQWTAAELDDADGSTYHGKGNGFGFLVSQTNSPVRISDIVTSEWNGMPDSARSMELQTQDILLMANGTDRMAGRVTGVADGHVMLKGRHGSFRLPLSETAEVRFARESLAAPVEGTAQSVRVQFAPLGRITGEAVAATADQLTLKHPAAGEIKINLEPAVMLGFQDSKRIIDDWDSDF